MWVQKGEKGPHMWGQLVGGGRAGDNSGIFMPSPKLFQLNYVVPFI